MQVNGGAYFDLEIGEYKDFLNYDDILYFEMTEYSGCAGQVFVVHFRTLNANIKKLVLENNPVTIKFGASKSTAETYTVHITEPEANQDASNNYWMVSFAGVQVPDVYINRASEAVTGTSLDVIKHIANTHFKGIETNITKVSEKSCHWIRKYDTVANFLKEAWLHMYMGATENCPALYIDKKNKVHLLDLEEIKKGKPSVKFVGFQRKAGTNEIQYLNNFMPKSYKFATNLYTGYGCVVGITKIKEGKEVICIPENKPDIASTKRVEKSGAGVRYIINKINGGNTHEHYQLAYYVNVARLVRLSSIVGELQVAGNLPNVKILDLIEVDDGTKVHSGYYLVNTKVTYFSYNTPVNTKVYVCRDNKNNIEDSLIDKGKKVFKISNKVTADLVQKLRNIRRLVALAGKVMDGSLVREVIAYTKNFKYNLLNSIVFAGVNINLNSQVELMQSLSAVGNSLVNKIINTFIPYPYNYVLKDVAVQNYSMSTLVSRLLNEFAPTEIKTFLVELTALLTDVTHISDYLYKDNAQALSDYNYSSGGYGTEAQQEGQDMSTQQNTERVQNITDTFTENTEGADLPIPMIDLTESESLLNDTDLTDLLADKVIDELLNQGYLKDMTDDEVASIKNALLGTEKLDLTIIDKIKTNTGEMMYCRYWGAFNNTIELTDFFITNSYKDIYLTAPTTKIINALKGARIFIAYPKSEEDLKFYINNEEVDMEVMEDIDLGLYNTVGNPLLYNVYMSEETFNSNNVVLEVRKD